VVRNDGKRDNSLWHPKQFSYRRFFFSFLAKGLQIEIIMKVKHEMGAVSYQMLGGTRAFWICSEIQSFHSAVYEHFN
jgi:hypothetical protein